METALPLLIIRGTPGAGKSSLGRRLKKTFPSGALLEIDNFRGMLNNVDWQDEQQHFIALSAAAVAINSFAGWNVSPVIVVDMFMDDKLNFFLSRISVNNYRIVSLLVNENVLGKRLTERKEGFKDITKGIAINHHLALHPRENEITIDTSAMDKNEVLEACLQQLQ